MKLSRLETIVIISPVLVNLGLSYAMMQVDLHLYSYAHYILLALFAMTFYPIFAGLVLKTKMALGFYLLVHTATALLSIYTIYNDSALFYLYLSLGLFTITVLLSSFFRKKKVA